MGNNGDGCYMQSIPILYFTINRQSVHAIGDARTAQQDANDDGQCFFSVEQIAHLQGAVGCCGLEHHISTPFTIRGCFSKGLYAFSEEYSQAKLILLSMVSQITYESI